MTNRLGDLTRTVGLPVVKKAAGVATRLLPIPQPTLLVGPGASARLGQAIGSFGRDFLCQCLEEKITSLLIDQDVFFE